jgi:putative glutamine amidotransferase
VEQVRRGPLVGLTGRRVRAEVLGAPHGFQDAPVDAYFSEYAASVARAGAVPMHVPQGVDVAALADVLDALLLSGGDDVDPGTYGGVLGPRVGRIDPERDAFESALLVAVLERDKPVLGICRGAQLLNVVLGGDLVEDLVVGEGCSHASYAYPRAWRRHGVTFEPGSLAHRLYGDQAVVNSFHHQAVRRPGAGVLVSGRADDGVVEAIELEGGLALGVQWHPECLDDDPAFGWLVRAGADRLHAARSRVVVPLGDQHHEVARIPDAGIDEVTAPAV